MDEHEIAEALGAWGSETGPLYVTLADALEVELETLIGPHVGERQMGQAHEG